MGSGIEAADDEDELEMGPLVTDDEEDEVHVGPLFSEDEEEPLDGEPVTESDSEGYDFEVKFWPFEMHVGLG